MDIPSDIAGNPGAGSRGRASSRLVRHSLSITERL